eukprot:m.483647 g.483647  ORF g.483647 m.483647 type:complete len:105 (-) comp23019_c0_seq1:158-472(-)
MATVTATEGQQVTVRSRSGAQVDTKRPFEVTSAHPSFDETLAGFSVVDRTRLAIMPALAAPLAYSFGGKSNPRAAAATGALLGVGAAFCMGYLSSSARLAGYKQ